MTLKPYLHQQNNSSVLSGLCILLSATLAHLKKNHHTRSVSYNDPPPPPPPPPRGGAIFDPRGMIGRIYVELHMTLLHIIQIYKLCVMRDFFMYFHNKSMVDNDMPGAWPVWTPRALLAGFINRSTIHCSTQSMKPLGYVVSEKIFMGANAPRGGAIFDHRGMIVRIYKEDHYTLLHTKYESSGPCGFGEEDFYVFHMTPPPPPPPPPWWGLYGPQGHGWQDLIRAVAGQRARLLLTFVKHKAKPDL